MTRSKTSSRAAADGFKGYLDSPSDGEYSIEYPNAAADGNIDGLWYDATFVGYVRKNFEWGGFPGWERYSDRPEEELTLLRKGLLAI